MDSDSSSSSAARSPSHTLIGHEANVCALHVSVDGKRIVSGSWDKSVAASAPPSSGSAPRGELCSVLPPPATDTGTLYRTAKVWKDWQLAYTLEGHEQSVWAVLALEGNGSPDEEDLVLTGAFRLPPSPDPSPGTS